MAVGKTKQLLVFTAASGGMAFFLNLILIPLYGIVGAAMAATVSLSFLSILFLSYTYRVTKIHPFKKALVKLAFSASIAIGIVYLLVKSFFKSLPDWAMVVTLFSFPFIYFLLLLSLKFFEEEDVMILRAIERKSGIRIEFLRKIIKKFFDKK
jgi:O-antigen/teichoic acid export membrane protein